MLKSRSNFPPGGFEFYQPETGWSPTKYLGFDATVDEIIKHRAANPRFNLPTDRRTVEQQLDDFTTLRLQRMPDGWSYLIPDASQPPPESFPRHLSHRPAAGAVGVGDYAKDITAGIGLWVEWFGDKPVEKKVAEERASICRQCPLNVTGNWMQRMSEVAAKEITAIMGSLKKQKMKTHHDDALGVCDACNCPLKAKVWAPAELIQKHMRPEAEAKLWEKCWMRKIDA
jgi:hypothetical protein